jgi:citrate lyase subunit beta/citryl-CoA lyase
MTLLASPPRTAPAPGQALHPRAALYGAQARPRALPVCDHYAGSERYIRKALALQAATAQDGRARFDLTADCEDGTPLGAEVEHARLIGAIAASADNRCGRLGVRIHDPASPHWRADLEHILPLAAARLAYVVVPKLQSAAELDAVARHVDALAPDAALPLHALIETHAALREVQAIAAHPRVDCLSFGLMDFVSAHGGAIGPEALVSPGQFDHPLVRRAKLEISAAAHAWGKVASHNVSTALHDAARVREDARRAASDFGYLRMWSVHPDQIEAVVEALTPSDALLDRAAAVICAAQAAGWGPTREGEQLHDRASYRLFWQLLERAHACGVALPEAARPYFTPVRP